MTAIGPAMGARIRYWRTKRNISQTALGEQLGLTGGWVSAVERGERTAGADRLSVLVPLMLALRTDLRTFLTEPIPGLPTLPIEWLEQVDEALGFGGTHAGIAPIARTLVGTGPDVLVLAKDPRGGLHLMQRRDAIKRGFEVAGVVGAAAIPVHPELRSAVAHAMETRSPNTEAVLAYRGILDALRQADDRLGSNPDLLHAAEIHLETVKGWLGTAGAGRPDGLVGELARLAAEYATSCGWMAYDQGHSRKAIGLYRDALGQARMLDDRPLAALVNGRIAVIQSELSDPRAAAEGTVRAVDLVTGTGAWKVATEVHGARARVLARLGDADGSLASLGAAEDAVGRADVVDTPYAYYIGPAFVAGYRGYSLADLGQHERAQQMLRELTSSTPTGESSHFARRRARWLIQLAESYAMARDDGSACRTARDVAESLRTVSSGWVARRLRRLHGQLAKTSRGTTVAQVKELGALLKGL